MHRIRLILTALVRAFSFLERRRERLNALRAAEAAERAAERQHQFAMLETIFGKMVEMQREQSAGILALAQAQQASADVLATWLKGFHISDPTPERPHVVREEDEWVAEQRRLAELGDPNAFPVDLPPEFQLAFALDKANEAYHDATGFDREGKDF